MNKPATELIDLRPLLKEIGRGAHGARALAGEDARKLFGAMLDGAVPDMELGAILLAYRIKGETAGELQAFALATSERTMRLKAPSGGRVVLLPSYNGARKLPNLTPLTAMLLARRGISSLIHGVSEAHGRVTTEAVLSELGIPVANSPADAEAALGQRRVAYAPLELLCPGLAALIATRQRLGVRGPAHTVAKLIDPFEGKSVRVVPLTHPPYFPNMRECLAASTTPALLMRGSEGEPTAGPKRPLNVECWRGDAWEELSEPRPDEVPLPEVDAASTARWTEAALAGKAPVPATVLRLVEWLAEAAAWQLRRA
jgi:anthranilate phosphoribosyltransferase